MKPINLFTILLLLLSLNASAQDYKKQYIAPTGDTITPKSLIRINKISYDIYPNFTHEDGDMKRNAAQRFLNVQMLGQSFDVTRMTRINKRGGAKNDYKQIVVLFIKDRAIHPIEGQAYWIDIDNALTTGAVSVINSTQ